jgi:RNA polymerase sigma-70 factor (ECF subfamily)
MDLIDWPRCLAQHERWLRGIILARTGEPQAVDEVWQEVALAAVQQRAPIQQLDRVVHWIYRLAVILSIRYRRQHARQRKRLAGLVQSKLGQSDRFDDPAEWVLLEERRSLVRNALELLPGRDAEILILKYHEKWSYRKIATVLNISETAVDARAFRARQRLRSALARHFVEEDVR